MRGRGKAATLLGCVVLMGGLVGACGDDSDSGGGGGTTSRESGSTSGAKTIDVKSMDGAKEKVTYCTGKDTSGAQKESVKLFNQANESNGLSAKLLEFPESADEQRTSSSSGRRRSRASATSSTRMSSGPRSSLRRTGSMT